MYLEGCKSGSRAGMLSHAHAHAHTTQLVSSPRIPDKVGRGSSRVVLASLAPTPTHGARWAFLPTDLALFSPFPSHRPPSIHLAFCASPPRLLTGPSSPFSLTGSPQGSAGEPCLAEDSGADLSLMPGILPGLAERHLPAT